MMSILDEIPWGIKKILPIEPFRFQGERKWNDFIATPRIPPPAGSQMDLRKSIATVFQQSPVHGQDIFRLAVGRNAVGAG
jgi:hypothetical protein